ncbi:DUF6328 family protein [Yinghuangia seranimata]|uniref:DUF6328 family protein n=1 Tax=Yinghuangia seranimata TaxID=408067 RepID=UPI00248D29FC|nr:DUF6328 family protein [Yinghuangia seranimata]MDI2124763.1 DUF6328 family protein [Yinghuangia seranimata]
MTPSDVEADGGGMAQETGESPEQHAERRWLEPLQEVRVVQTGSQVLFGFLPAVAFTPAFDRLGGFDKGAYTVAVVLGAASISALVAVVAFHLALRGMALKVELVRVTSWLVSLGVTMMAGTMVCSVLLLLRVATGDVAAAWITAAMVLWFLACWLVLPVVLRRRARTR